MSECASLLAVGQSFAKIFSKFGQDRNSTKNDRNLGDVDFSPIFAKITLFIPARSAGQGQEEFSSLENS
jgi:hypothetical protein